MNNETIPLLSNKAYNLIKAIVQLLIPAASSLYLLLSGLWGLPFAQQIVGTLSGLATFLGVLLRISTKSYDNSDAKYDGKVLIVDDEDGPKLFSLELNGNPLDLEKKKSISFKIGP